MNRYKQMCSRLMIATGSEASALPPEICGDADYLCYFFGGPIGPILLHDPIDTVKKNYILSTCN